MVPPESFSIEAPHSSMDFCNGCDGGTQCESFSSKVLPSADAVPIPTESARPSAARPQSLMWRVRRMVRCMMSLPAVRWPQNRLPHLIAEGFGCTGERRSASALFRFRLINAVPILRRRIGAIARDALDIHVVKSGDIEAVRRLAAAIDEIKRLVPLLLAIAGDHARIELAQLLAMRILLDFRAPEHRIHGLRLFLALHLDQIDLHRGKLLLGLFRST